VLATSYVRLQACRLADDIIVATTTMLSTMTSWPRRARRRPVVSRQRTGRASADTSVPRVKQATIWCPRDIDCPLIDSETVDRVIAGPCRAHRDAWPTRVTLSSGRIRAGWTPEALFADVLERAGRMASRALARTVTAFVLEERPDLFVLES